MTSSTISVLQALIIRNFYFKSTCESVLFLIPIYGNNNTHFLQMHSTAFLWTLEKGDTKVADNHKLQLLSYLKRLKTDPKV